jgi:hypothetical protein
VLSGIFGPVKGKTLTTSNGPVRLGSLLFISTYRRIFWLGGGNISLSCSMYRALMNLGR